MRTTRLLTETGAEGGESRCGISKEQCLKNLQEEVSSWQERMCVQHLGKGSLP